MPRGENWERICWKEIVRITREIFLGATHCLANFHEHESISFHVHDVQRMNHFEYSTGSGSNEIFYRWISNEFQAEMTSFISERMSLHAGNVLHTFQNFISHFKFVKNTFEIEMLNTFLTKYSGTSHVLSPQTRDE